MRGREREPSVARERRVEQFDERRQERCDALRGQRDERPFAHPAVHRRVGIQLREVVRGTYSKIAQRFQHDRQQRDAFCANGDAEIEIEPAVLTCLDARIPFAGFNQFVRKRRIDLDAPAALAQRGYGISEKSPPSAGRRLPGNRNVELRCFDVLDLRPARLNANRTYRASRAPRIRTHRAAAST